MTISVTALATKAALVTTSAPSATLIFVDPSFRHSVHVAADAPARSANSTADVGTEPPSIIKDLFGRSPDEPR